MTRAGAGNGGWRVPARLARRDARRRPWRTLLMVVLIGLPVAGATGTAITIRANAHAAAEARAADFGRADAIVSAVDGDGPGAADRLDAALRAGFPSGSEWVTFRRGPDALELADGSLEYIEVTNPPVDEPMLDGLVRLSDGRAPEQAGEIALNEAALDATNTQVGDEAELVLGGRVRIVGALPDSKHREPAAVTAVPPAVHPTAGCTRTSMFPLVWWPPKDPSSTGSAKSSSSTAPSTATTGPAAS